MKNRFISIISILLTLCVLLSGCAGASTSQPDKHPGETNSGYSSESTDSSLDNNDLPAVQKTPPFHFQAFLLIPVVPMLRLTAEHLLFQRQN